MESIRSTKQILRFFLFISLSVLGSSAYADTRYVSDTLIITLREAPNAGGRAIRTLRTDTPVEVLEESGRYLKVQTNAGEVGWVTKQYITSETPKPIIIARLKDEVKRLGARIKEFEEGDNPFLDQLKTAEQSYLRKVKEFEKNAEKLIDERNSLKATNAKLNAELRSLEQRIENLRGSGKLRWFLAGAAVFCLGLIAGQVSRRKKRYYIDL